MEHRRNTNRMERMVPCQYSKELIKGDLQEWKNYRGIMLLSEPGKVLKRSILERLKNEVDNLLRDHQV